MPELPDITLYLEALGERIVGSRLERVTLINAFLLRTAMPPLASVAGRRVEQLRRMVAQGAYKVSPQRLALKILVKALQER